VWSEGNVQVEIQNTVMTLSIMKRINSELLIDRIAENYIMDGRIKDENVISVINRWNLSIRGLSLQNAKDVQMRITSLFQNDFNRDVKEFEHKRYR